MDIDTLIHARWIIPVEPDDKVYVNHSIAVNNGKILALLPTTTALEQFNAQEEHHFDQHALIPGLINAHTHAAMTLFRGLADDLPLMQWLNDHIWPAEREWVGPEFVIDGTRLAIAEMLRSGTTCFNDMYFYPDHTAEAASSIGIRAVIGLIMIDFPTTWAKDHDEYLFKGEQVHDKIKHDPLVRTAFAPHAPYTVSDGPLQRIGVIAEELDIQIHMHVHETDAEITKSLEQYGKRPVQRLCDLGLFSSRLIAVHMTHLEQGEIEKLSQFGVHVVHCPESNLKLASGFCPVKELVDRDINVALGTDSAASNNDLDMFGEMRTAALLAKGVARDSTCISAYTALRMATINGARALGMDNVTGSLAADKEADIVAIDLGTISTQPLYDPISQIVYAGNKQLVSSVWVAGKQLLRNHEFTNIDTEQLLRKVHAWQEKIC
jgi:5-methylthioadenosine/S-adenosylhomocysteine deaminase